MKIGLDFDGVIANTPKLKSELAREMFGVDVPHGRMKDECLEGTGLTLDQYRAVQQRVYTDFSLVERLEPVMGALEGIRRMHARRHSVISITQRSNEGLAIAKAWREKYSSFTSDFNMIIIGVGRGNSKEEACEELDVYADDTFKVIQEVRFCVPNPFLFHWGYNSGMPCRLPVRRAVDFTDLTSEIDEIKYDLDYYTAAALDSAVRGSRTMKKGKIDATYSGAKDKPKGIIADSDAMKAKVAENLRKCVMLAYLAREQPLNPEEFRCLFEILAAQALDGTIEPRATIYRTHEIAPGKGYGVPTIEVEPMMNKFYEWAAEIFNRKLSRRELLVYSAIIEKIIDKDLHSVADACGRIARLTSMFLAMRNSAPVKQNPGREVATYEAMGLRVLDEKMFEPESAQGLTQIYRKSPYFVLER